MMHSFSSKILLFFLVFLTLCKRPNAFQVSKQGQLDQIHQITTNEAGIGCIDKQYELVPVPVSTKSFKSSEEKAELASNLIEDTKSIGNHQFIYSSLRHLLREEFIIDEARVVSFEPFWVTSGTKKKRNSSTASIEVQFQNSTESESLENAPWMLTSIMGTRKFLNTNFMRSQEENGFWTYPYFHCKAKTWKISFVATISSEENLSGFLSFDVDITHDDINQCDKPKSPNDLFSTFIHTHKCHLETSQCIFEPGHGWTRGGYKCQCKEGFYSKTEQMTFNGSLVEVAYEAKLRQNDNAYDQLYICGKCQDGCGICIDDTPCLADFNWTFRWILLIFSLCCTLATFILIILVYTYRKLKVFRLGSPTFLCVTLVGCAIMYFEMVAIFPVLDVYFCIATKWTRHLGFLLTYSSLLLKTWRVNLTFRVKSAHKLKLTDKQLLQWLFPILLVMMVYLSAWTLSDPPQAVYIKDGEGLKFKICFFGWWDHCMAAGEFLFLMWGIKVCFNVRKARTHYNEAKWITWSIYNIAIVNIIMIAIHLFLLPSAGPDMKYFLGFLRTQLSTTVTIILVFGPKFYRVLRGTANELDDRIRARGNAASMIEVPLEKDGAQKDVYAENEELKEEIQKLAGQIQYLKIVGMLMENRHIKPKRDGYFSKENCSKHLQHFLVRNGTVINCTSKRQKTQTPENGTLMSPNSGQAIILAEKSEDNSYKIIEKNLDSIKSAVEQ